MHILPPKDVVGEDVPPEIPPPRVAAQNVGFPDVERPLGFRALRRATCTVHSGSGGYFPRSLSPSQPPQELSGCPSFWVLLAWFSYRGEAISVKRIRNLFSLSAYKSSR